MIVLTILVLVYLGTPVTPKLKQVYESNQGSLSVVYVSSDRSKEQMVKSMQQSHGSWHSIPFENEQERAELKRHFNICAGSEREALGIAPDKRIGIPSLVIVEKNTEEVLTLNGVEGLDKLNPLAFWRKES